MKKLLLIALLSPLFCFAQTGVQFEHLSGWNEVLAKAKAENKYIFVDAFTTWCGPCRYMTSTIFPKKQVGDFFNKNFINVKVQLDTTEADNEDIKHWYADAHSMMTEYSVNAFPTFLFFNPEGKIVHRLVGADPDINEFIASSAKALSEETQYYTLLERYKQGQGDSGFLRKLTYAAAFAGNHMIAKFASTQYIKTQPDLFTKENMEFLWTFTNLPTDTGFAIIMANQAKFDAMNGKGSANKQLVDIIFNKEVSPLIYLDTFHDEPQWDDLKKDLTKKYPAQADEVLMRGKMEFYQSENDWKNYGTLAMNYLKKYGANASADELNTYAWTMFENCTDTKCLQEALLWSKRSFAKSNDPMFIDTYANLLYKLGRKQEAITWETKALSLAPEADKKTYSQTLDKMKKGQKTW